MKNKLQNTILILFGAFYLLFAISYITISINESFTYNLVPFIFATSLILLFVLFLFIQSKHYNSVFSVLFLILLIAIFCVYSVWFGLVDCQNLNALLKRINGKATTIATTSDYVICVFLIIEVILMIGMVVLSIISIITNRRTNKTSKQLE